MSINTKIYYIQVPLNSAGLNELEISDDEFANVSSFEFSVGEIEILIGLFRMFNSAFNILIDEYENERLPAEYVSSALKITHDFLAKFDNNEAKIAINRVISALQLAMNLNMPLDFDF